MIHALMLLCMQDRCHAIMVATHGLYFRQLKPLVCICVSIYGCLGIILPAIRPVCGALHWWRLVDMHRRYQTHEFAKSLI